MLPVRFIGDSGAGMCQFQEGSVVESAFFLHLALLWCLWVFRAEHINRSHRLRQQRKHFHHFHGGHQLQHVHFDIHHASTSFHSVSGITIPRRQFLPSRSVHCHLHSRQSDSWSFAGDGIFMQVPKLIAGRCRSCFWRFRILSHVGFLMFRGSFRQSGSGLKRNRIMRNIHTYPLHPCLSEGFVAEKHRVGLDLLGRVLLNICKYQHTYIYIHWFHFNWLVIWGERHAQCLATSKHTPIWLNRFRTPPSGLDCLVAGYYIRVWFNRWTSQSNPRQFFLGLW